MKCSLWGHKELDMAERLLLSLSRSLAPKHQHLYMLALDDLQSPFLIPYLL